MKVRLALAASLLVFAGAAGAALNAYRTAVTLPQGVKLGDGSVLISGIYDVEIHYKGFGNAAELLFFQKGNLKGKSPAEARGFPSTDPAGAAGGVDKVNADKVAKMDFDYKTHAVSSLPAGAPDSFSWGARGFNPGTQGKVVPAGRGSVKLLFDSSNSAAGFNAILPYVEKGTK